VPWERGKRAATHSAGIGQEVWAHGLDVAVVGRAEGADGLEVLIAGPAAGQDGQRQWDVDRGHGAVGGGGGGERKAAKEKRVDTRLR